VLGHRGYYPRFGFSAALASGLSARLSGTAFMALELVPGVLAGKNRQRDLSASLRHRPSLA